MRALAFALCILPGALSAQGVTIGIYPADQATFQSGRCLQNINDFSGTMMDVLPWLMNQAQQGFKEATFFGCYSPITNTQAYRDVRDDLTEGGYGVSLNNTTNTFTVTWP